MGAWTHGAKAVFKFDNAAGVLTDISSYLTSVALKSAADQIDKTVKGDRWNVYLVISRDITITLQGHFDGDVNTNILSVFALANLGALGEVALRSWEYGPLGQVAGKPQMLGEAYLTEFNVEATLDTPVNWTAILLVTNGMTIGNY